MSYQDPSTAVNPYAASAMQDQNTLTGMQAAGGAPGGTSMAPPIPAPSAGNLSYQYPSYPNAAGLGSQNPNSGFSASTPANGDSGTAFSSTPITVNTPDTSSRGSNPWSFMGEANSRDTVPPISTPQQAPQT